MSATLSHSFSGRRPTHHAKASKSQNRSSTVMVEALEERQFMSVTLPTAAAAPRATAAPQTAVRYAAQASFQVATATLDDEVTATDTMPSFHVKNLAGAWPADNSRVFFRVDGEKMLGYIHRYAGGSVVLGVASRAQEGTTAMAHRKGAVVTTYDPTVVTAPVTDTSTQFVNIGGALWSHKGLDPNKGWSKLWDTGVKQVSASKRAPDTVFVVFNTGALYEHVGVDKNSGWYKLWDTGVKQVSAGTQSGANAAQQADAAFVLFESGAMYEHTGRDRSLGWYKLWDTGITQISASQLQLDTVYANFNGAVWEHNGRDRNAGWTGIWSTGVAQVEASSVQYDTCYTVFSGTGALYEHMGKDRNIGWYKLWDTGVKQVSASQTQANTTFVLFNSGALYHHTGLSSSAGWSKLWDTGVTQIGATARPDTVLVNINGALWQHTGLDKNSGWARLWSVGVIGMDGGTV